MTAAVPDPIRRRTPADEDPDRDYDGVLRRALAIVERTAPGNWSDHNAPDPGITLLELLAWSVAEQHYRLWRAGSGSGGPTRLVDGTLWPPSRDTALGMTPVTAEDYAALARSVVGVRRAWAVPALLPGLNWDGRVVSDRPVRAGGLTVVVDPGEDPAGAPPGAVLLRLLDAIGDRLDPYGAGRAVAVAATGPVTGELAVARVARRRVICDEIRVAVLERVDVVVAARVHVRPGRLRADLEGAARKRVEDYFAGGRTGEGWRPGEPIPVSEVIRALADAPEVAGITETSVEVAGAVTTMHTSNDTEAELPDFTVPRLSTRRCIRVDFVIEEASR